MKANTDLMARPFSPLLKTWPQDISRFYYLGCALFSVALMALIIGVMALQTGPALWDVGPALLSVEWNPAADQYGVIPMLFGTFIVMFIAMIMALPIGIMAAIYIAETRSDTLRRFMRGALEILAGIPSIVYGLIGVAYVSVWVAKGFDLQSGRLILTAGLILSVMILPTILSLTTDAILNVPKDYRENAASLGLYRVEIFKEAIWPSARKEVIGAALLALGRAMGETMAVMLVIGSLDRLPTPLYNVLSSSQSVTSKLGREVSESAFGSTHFSVLIFMGLILMCITIGLTALSQMMFNRTSFHGQINE